MQTPLAPRWLRVCLWIAVAISLLLVYAASWLLVL